MRETKNTGFKFNSCLRWILVTLVWFNAVKCDGDIDNASESSDRLDLGSQWRGTIPITIPIQPESNTVDECGRNCSETVQLTIGMLADSPYCLNCVTYFNNGVESAQCDCEYTVHECRPEFWGLKCANRCNSICMRNSGSCGGLYGNGTCICPSGRIGVNCERCEANMFGINCDQTCPDCGPNGRCLAGPTGTGQCRCDRNYEGRFCERQRCADDLVCEEGQFCDRNGTRPRCRCHTDYWDGSQCAENGCLNYEGSDAGHCLHIDYAKCNPKPGNRFECVCKSGFHSQPSTELELLCAPDSPCSLNPCEHDDNSVCRPLSENPFYYCACNRGTFRAENGRCEADPCGTIRCLPIEVCVRNGGNASCDCAPASYHDNGRCNINFTDPQIGELYLHALDVSEISWLYSNVSTIFNLSQLATLTSVNQTLFSVLFPRNLQIYDGVNPEAYVKFFTFAGQLQAGEIYNVLGFKFIVHQNGDSGVDDEIVIAPAEDPEYSDSDATSAMLSSRISTHFVLPGNFLDAAPYHMRLYAANLAEPIDFMPSVRLYQIELQSQPWQTVVQNEAPTFYQYLSLSASRILSQNYTIGSIFVPIESAWNRSLSVSELRSVQTQSILRNSLMMHHFLPVAVSVTQLISNAFAAQFSPQNLYQTLALERIEYQVARDKRLCLSDSTVCVLLGDVLAADGVLIHFIDRLLIPQSFKDRREQLGESRRCDVEVWRNTTYRCIASADCPNGGTAVKIERNCGQDAQMQKLYSLVCQSSILRPECCDGHYGSWCLACPGPADRPCNNHGTCDSGYFGSGRCNCAPPFTGEACDKCIGNKFGSNCDQDCSCKFGECANTIDGDGQCVQDTCQSGYEGPKCDIKLVNCTDNQNTLPCNHLAYCVHEDSIASDVPNLHCHCPPGYSGDGLDSCEEIDPCAGQDRGGCHIEADCEKIGPGRANCTCRRGWFGDGENCYVATLCNRAREADCGENAVCVDTLPNHFACVCADGYYGNGSYCRPIEACGSTESECDANAICSVSKFEGKQCKCKAGYYGNGHTCLRTIAQKLVEMDEGEWFSGFNRGNLVKLTLPKLNKLDVDDRHAEYTVFMPSLRALRRLNASMSAVARHDFASLVGCGIFEDQTTLVNHETNGANFTIMPSFHHIQLVIDDNNVAEIGGVKIVTRNILAANGVVHEIDGILPCEADQSSQSAVIQKFEDSQYFSLQEFLAQNYQYSDFFEKLQETGLSSILRRLQKMTIFALSNSAMATSNVVMDKRQLGYYIVPDLVSLDSMYGFARQSEIPSLYDTLAGRYNKIGVMRKGADWLITSEARSDTARLYPSVYLLSSFINTNLSVSPLSGSGSGTEQGLHAKQPAITVLIYGVESVLHPHLGVCERITYDYQPGVCMPCSESETNMSRSLCIQNDYTAHPVAVERKNCPYMTDFNSSCVKYHICQKAFVSRQCCPGYFGPDCANECPGGATNPCNSNGKCLDGLNGNGSCVCFGNYTGESCSLCKGSFLCKADTECNSRNGGCHPNATCRSNDQYAAAECECNPGFHGNGIFCETCLREGRRPCLSLASCVRVGGGAAPTTATATTTTTTESYECVCPEGMIGDGERFCVEDKCLNWNTQKADRLCWSEQANCTHSISNNTQTQQLAVKYNCMCPPNHIAHTTGEATRCHGDLLSIIRRIDPRRNFFSRIQPIAIRPLTVLYPNDYAERNYDDIRAFLVEGNVTLSSVAKIKTLDGREHAVVFRDGSYKIGDSMVLDQNLPAIDGVVHVVQFHFTFDDATGEITEKIKYRTVWSYDKLQSILIAAGAMIAIVLVTIMSSLLCIRKRRLVRRDRMRQRLLSNRSNSIVSAARSSMPPVSIRSAAADFNNTYNDSVAVAEAVEGQITYNPIFRRSIESIAEGAT